MKKLALLTLLCSVTVAHAHVKSPFSGWTVIGGVGGVIMGHEATQHVDAKGETTVVPLMVPAMDTLSTNDDIFESNVVGMLGVGYSYQFQNGVVVSLFGTANTNYTSFEDTDSPVSVINGGPDAKTITQTLTNELETTLQNDFAVLFKAGLVFDDHTLVYAFAGPRWGRFENSLESAYVLSIVPNSSPQTGTTISIQGEDNDSGYQIGYTVGAGMSHALTTHVLFGMEYAFTGYGDLDSLHTSASCLESASAAFCELGDFNTIMDGEGKVEANTNVLMATLAYVF